MKSDRRGPLWSAQGIESDCVPSVDKVNGKDVRTAGDTENRCATSLARARVLRGLGEIPRTALTLRANPASESQELAPASDGVVFLVFDGTKSSLFYRCNGLVNSATQFRVVSFRKGGDVVVIGWFLLMGLPFEMSSAAHAKEPAAP